MNEARLIEDVETFFEACTVSGVRVLIISHKTEYAKMGKTETNLRAASLSWMKGKRCFETYGVGFLIDRGIF